MMLILMEIVILMLLGIGEPMVQLLRVMVKEQLPVQYKLAQVEFFL